MTVTPRDYIQISIAIHVTHIKGLQTLLITRDRQHLPVFRSVISSPRDAVEVGTRSTGEIIDDKVDISVAIHIPGDSAPRVYSIRQRDVVLGDIYDLGRSEACSQNNGSDADNE